MREIKFRAWHEASKSFFNWNDISINGRNNCIIHFNEGVFEQNTNTNPVVLNQYTGLKDKNGEESYEKDVCDYVYYIQQSMNPDDFAEYKGKGKIEFIEGCFMINPFKGNPIPLHYGDLSFEIIGNIHQNPELCK
jgi:uncharacterized phage protein (TIGR01671 family)